MKQRGTPKTLNEAIDNGVEEFLQADDTEDLSSANLKRHLKNHIQDFFRNSISPLYLFSDELPEQAKNALEILVKRIG